MNEQIIFPFIKELQEKLKNEDFVIDKSGVKIVEVIDANIKELDPFQEKLNFKGKKTNEEYVKKEKQWYLSMDLRIIGWVDDVAIWNYCCSKDEKKTINSNYGYLVYSKENHNQFYNCLNTLKNHKDSRQAVILYNRPSIHNEWNESGKSDFICTFYQHFFIRNNKLICITNMRSNDCVFGLFNDLPWFFYVYRDMYNKLLESYPNLEKGFINFNANSLHVYERHFDLLSKIELGE